jgi:hypothetical protein
VDPKVERYVRTRTGLNWQSFNIYDSPELERPDTGFQGATGLPDSNKNATWIAAQHWCAAVTEISLPLSGASWSVTVEDHEIKRSERSKTFDPSSWSPPASRSTRHRGRDHTLGILIRSPLRPLSG